MLRGRKYARTYCNGVFGFSRARVGVVFFAIVLEFCFRDHVVECECGGHAMRAMMRFPSLGPLGLGAFRKGPVLLDVANVYFYFFVLPLLFLLSALLAPILHYD